MSIFAGFYRSMLALSLLPIHLLLKTCCCCTGAVTLVIVGSAAVILMALSLHPDLPSVCVCLASMCIYGVYVIVCVCVCACLLASLTTCLLADPFDSRSPGTKCFFQSQPFFMFSPKRGVPRQFAKTLRLSRGAVSACKVLPTILLQLSQHVGLSWALPHYSNNNDSIWLWLT